MRKLLLAVLLFIASPWALAETLTPDMIKQIHDQVKNSFFEGCSKDVKGTAVDICRCLADKTQASLDDAALGKCNNDNTGKDCVTNAVKAASMKATSKDNIAACKTQAESAAGTTAAPAASTTAAPAAATTTPASTN